jgi:hypothetical protein
MKRIAIALIALALAGCANMGGMQPGLQGLPNVPNVGMSELTLTAPCPAVQGQAPASAVYRAPFGGSTGSVSATCQPTQDGKGVTVSVTNGWDPIAVMQQMTALGVGVAGKVAAAS